jgi:hypothetical protein
VVAVGRIGIGGRCHRVIRCASWPTFTRLGLISLVDLIAIEELDLDVRLRQRGGDDRGIPGGGGAD